MKRFLPAIALVLIGALVCLSILSYPHLPLVDLPNHIAQLYLAANTDSELGTIANMT